MSSALFGYYTITELQSALSSLSTVTQNLQQHDGSHNNRAAAAALMTKKLYKDHDQLITKTDLRHAMAYG